MQRDIPDVYGNAMTSITRLAQNALLNLHVHARRPRWIQGPLWLSLGPNLSCSDLIRCSSSESVIAFNSTNDLGLLRSIYKIHHINSRPILRPSSSLAMIIQTEISDPVLILGSCWRLDTTAKQPCCALWHQSAELDNSFLS